MPSPYPGMDPYLEAHWGDIHQSLIIYARDTLQAQLPKALRARVEERVYVHYDDMLRRTVVPDIRIRERPGDQPTSPQTGSGPTPATVVADSPIADSIVITVDHEPISESFIEIIEAGGGRLVTTIEVISPANKLKGEGKKLYRKKQREMKHAGVNIVEIDLLRQGNWVLVAPRDCVPQSHREPYRVSVWRSKCPEECELYRASFRERLPVIRIPLRPSDTEVKLDLQALIDRCYTNGAYDDLDYSQEPDPPLSRSDQAWSHEWLSKQGKRK